MAGGIRKSFDGDDLEENHEINVTPFIDVILALLIIFMVAAPLATVDVNVDLPASTVIAHAFAADNPIFVTVSRICPFRAARKRSHPPAAWRGARPPTGGSQQRLFLRADRAADCCELMDGMNLLRGAGYLKIALVGLETVPTGETAPTGELGQ